MAGIFHRVEVIEIAEEFVEAVHRRQELVEVAQVVLAELAGGVAHRLQHGGDGHGLGRQADRGAGLADRGHAGADRQLAGDEVGASRRATRLGVVVGEQHALGGDLVEVRRAPGHHAAVVGADIPHADVVAHDDDDVRPLWRRLRDSGVVAHKPIATVEASSLDSNDRFSSLLSVIVCPLAETAGANCCRAGRNIGSCRRAHYADSANQSGDRIRVAKGASPNRAR